MISRRTFLIGSAAMLAAVLPSGADGEFFSAPFSPLFGFRSIHEIDLSDQDNQVMFHLRIGNGLLFSVPFINQGSSFRWVSQLGSEIRLFNRPLLLTCTPGIDRFVILIKSNMARSGRPRLFEEGFIFKDGKFAPMYDRPISFEREYYMWTDPREDGVMAKVDWDAVFDTPLPEIPSWRDLDRASLLDLEVEGKVSVPAIEGRKIDL
jgi:hypothetical protein